MFAFGTLLTAFVPRSDLGPWPLGSLVGRFDSASRILHLLRSAPDQAQNRFIGLIRLG